MTGGDTAAGAATVIPCSTLGSTSSSAADRASAQLGPIGAAGLAPVGESG